jgi:hypothetical protein
MTKEDLWKAIEAYRMAHSSEEHWAGRDHIEAALDDLFAVTAEPVAWQLISAGPKSDVTTWKPIDRRMHLFRPLYVAPQPDTKTREAVLEEAAVEFDKRNKGAGGFYDPEDPALIIRSLKGVQLVDTPAKPVGWGWLIHDGVYDTICPEEHARHEGRYTVPLYAAPQPDTKTREIEALNARIEHDFKRWQEAIANYDFERSLNEKLMDGSVKLTLANIKYREVMALALEAMGAMYSGIDNTEWDGKAIVSFESAINALRAALGEQHDLPKAN